ncbi:DUF885 domain-containing protein [Mucilaginibacter sp. UR6-1]|uniref:DUF885 domain-containing protein n=1 Tax=Mucilaginibacter sp. UR6-1 TaxID=1435643 RepID=UPI001E381577|nr:DUF885 domain-containing protein [Mucilaginibacter sp. UR6-1]MCC8409731.1 DUF885 domain-containing protein [Mucilaginibacter sp. UR6-1]
MGMIISARTLYKLLLIAICGFTFLSACKKDGMGGELSDEEKNNDSFTRYEGKFLDELWKLNPDWATSVGYHKYDSVLVLPSEQKKKLTDFAKSNLDSLSHYPQNELSASNRMDFNLIQNYLRKTEWTYGSLKAYEWDPTSYNIIGGFAYILNEKYAPLSERLQSFYEKMAAIPAYYKDAQKLVKNPVPELTDLAIDQMTGGVDVIEKDFIDSLTKSSVPDPKQKLMRERAKASAAVIRNFTAWLKTIRSDKGRSFRLGKSLYDEKFNYEIESALTSQQMFNAAVERKKFLHKEMIKLSKELWPKYMGDKKIPSDSLAIVEDIIGALSLKHVEPAQFQSAIEKQIPKLSAFVKEKDLLTMDPSKPLVVRREPAYMAGVAGASVSSPGPYEKNGNTYYNVGSLDGWDKDRAESYLREYNDYTLQILNIHEAIPGHYTQLVYANKAPSLIKSVLGNGAMVEGWAVYGEEMMLDAGYGGNEPEMRLMWCKWNLRTVCNAILDYSVHAGSMTREQALKLLTKEAFQQQAEAEGKWKRVSVSSVQLTSYFTGYHEIKLLREEYKKKMADKYRLKEFNEKFLSYGSAPVKYIKEAMLTNEVEKPGDKKADQPEEKNEKKAPKAEEKKPAKTDSGAQ